MGVRDTIAKALMGGVGGVNKVGRGGIDVYHSSPHDFEKFDWSKMGSGEGAQVRGKGFYFAESPAVSGQGGDYWNQFENRFKGPEGHAAEYLRQFKFDRDKATRMLRSDADDMGLRLGDVPALRERREALKLLEGGGPVGPRTYEVNIKTDPDKLLNLDVGTSAQSPYVEQRLRDLGVHPQIVSLENTQRQALDLIEQLRKVKGAAPWVHKDLDEVTAQVKQATRPNQIYSDIRDFPSYYDIPPRFGLTGTENSIWNDIAPDVHKRIGNIRASIAEQPAQMHVEEVLGGPERAADALRSVEIPGSRYYDAGSRNIRGEAMPDATYNYVINDPGKLDILKKYGVVGAPAGALAADQMGSTFDQRYYGEQP